MARLVPLSYSTQGIAHQNRVIRLPMHVHNLLNSVRRAKRELEANDGPEPTDSQVKIFLKFAHHIHVFPRVSKGGTPMAYFCISTA